MMETNPPSSIAEMHVLIVDDESMLRSVILEYLDLIGVKSCLMAEDGQQALEILRSQPPGEPIHCMISDIRMPRMELKELLGHINKEFPEIMVVATSGYSDMGSAHEIFEKGAQDFLAKPLNLDYIEYVLDWYVQRSQIIGAAQDALESGDYTALHGALTANQGLYAEKMRHAARIGELAEKIETGLKPGQRADLLMLAHLHEIGEGIQILDLCGQPRDLIDEELELVRSHAFISGRIVARAFDRSDLQEIVASHLNWEKIAVDLSQREAIEQSLTIWLGLLNNIDGRLSDRPDRAACSSKELKASLQNLFVGQCSLDSHPILDQWNVVEEYYA